MAPAKSHWIGKAERSLLYVGRRTEHHMGSQRIPALPCSGRSIPRSAPPPRPPHCRSASLGDRDQGIQHANTLFHRNVFVEDGLVSIVTSYHKGYTCTGTTKIIHRYLPREISELVVYYLWLILPFVQKMTLLIAEQADPEIPASNTRKIDSLIGGQSRPIAERSVLSFLLWPAGKGAWSSSRLTKILKRETSKICQSPLTLATYRHVAIAISRRHLAQGGFKRDYDVEESATDGQTAHTSWTAGRLYARGIEEAPGHVEARRAGFRMVSRS
jgi:hypothetical protein